METKLGDLVYLINGRHLNFVLIGINIWVFACDGGLYTNLISNSLNFTTKDITQILYSCGGKNIQNLIIFNSKDDIERAITTIKLIKG